MIQIQRVLCPVDFSPISARALRLAASLAAWYGARLTVLFVRTGERVTATERDLAVFAGSVTDAHPKLRVTEGDAVSGIVRLAAALPADVVVLGTHGLSGVRRLLLGSVTERVLREAPCPVLTVPARLVERLPDADSFSTIVCAVDFSVSSSRAIEYAASLARKAAGRLVLLHALEWFDEESEQAASPGKGRALPTAEDDARQELDALLTGDARDCEREVIVGRGAPHREILRVVNDYRAGLVVLGVHGRSVLDRALFGSTAQRVTREAPCLVLTVRT